MLSLDIQNTLSLKSSSASDLRNDSIDLEIFGKFYVLNDLYLNQPPYNSAYGRTHGVSSFCNTPLQFSTLIICPQLNINEARTGTRLALYMFASEVYEVANDHSLLFESKDTDEWLQTIQDLKLDTIQDETSMYT